MFACNAEVPASAPGAATDIAHGSLGSSLGSLANRSGPVTQKAIERLTDLPPDLRALVSELFPCPAIVRMSNLCWSNSCAERQVQRAEAPRRKEQFENAEEQTDKV